MRVRCQKARENFDVFVDVLFDLAENAYREADYVFKEELPSLWYIRSRSVCLGWYKKIMCQPASIAKAVRLVWHLESAREACQ